MTLSDDEYTVLMLISEGNPVMAIGRWAAPIEHLQAQGFLKRHDNFNSVITPKGRQALHAHEEKVDLGLVEACNKIANAKTQAEFAVTEATKQLVIAARATHAATGEPAADCAAKWMQTIMLHALEALAE